MINFSRELKLLFSWGILRSKRATYYVIPTLHSFFVNKDVIFKEFEFPFKTKETTSPIFRHAEITQDELQNETSLVVNYNFEDIDTSGPS